MEIRSEYPGDADEIRRLTNAAFKGAPYSQGAEAAIIDALRAAGVLAVSLVAVQDGEIVGHVAFSPVKIDGRAGDWYGLGPVSVQPAQQRQGIAQAMILEGFGRIRRMEAGGVVVLGNPAFYNRFGFISDPAIYYRNAVPGHFQFLAFAAAVPNGEVTYHAGFDAG